MSRRPLAEVVHPSWVPALTPVEPLLAEIGDRLRAEAAAGRPFLPAGGRIRVLILGQDPYPTPGHAVGLSFSVEADVRPLPRSLQNIFTELVDDLGVPRPSCGDLSPWCDRGVLLLNRVLTVGVGAPGSHRGWGWEQVTDAAVHALTERTDAPLVAILWGRDAQAVAPALDDVPCVMSAHPSPMSADRGFFGSRPFSRTNAHLVDLGDEPIDWSLP